jgi:hypothetical protein
LLALVLLSYWCLCLGSILAGIDWCAGHLMFIVCLVFHSVGLFSVGALVACWGPVELSELGPLAAFLMASIGAQVLYFIVFLGSLVVRQS